MDTEAMGKNAIDIQKLENRFLRDGLLLREVLKNYRITYAECMQGLRDSLGTGDKTILIAASHKLKGSTSNFVQNEITEKLQNIEDTKTVSAAEIQELETYLNDLISQIDILVQKWMQDDDQ